MRYALKPLDDSYRQQCRAIFNEIVDEGQAFPWEQPLDEAAFDKLYPPHESVWCAVDERDEVLGFVHVHPNGIGRCAHVANCGYSVRTDARGQGVGRLLVEKSLEVARAEGYRGIQFNAVVATNAAAIALYRSFDFAIVGTIPGGFRIDDEAGESRFVDRHIMFRSL
ncbi:MAG: GNAT family N-acetyltransferase [Coriobacteriales bacterium]|jgi:L-amino acid N-acyltransferase YncA|nr:GNAT family N-acetyltransferase [Coriobacteriales bacterium]